LAIYVDKFDTGEQRSLAALSIKDPRNLHAKIEQEYQGGWLLEG